MDSYLKTDPASSQSGFSLIEVLIAMGILALSMLAAAIIPRSTLRHRQLPGGCTVLAGIFLIPSSVMSRTMMSMKGWGSLGPNPKGPPWPPVSR